jgi:SAM-dependent methyltransferase
VKVFDLYAAYYDLLYGAKDYSAETEYVAGLIRKVKPDAKNLLDLGCGTGGHAHYFATQGFNVTGVDLSAAMIDRALEKKRAAPSEVSSLMAFRRGDIRNCRLEGQFDAVVSLFHVLSYQTSNSDQDAAFATARAHLRRNGVFVFDFWHGPAVLNDRPRHVVKEVADERIMVRRETTPVMHIDERCVDVKFDVDITSRLDDRAQRVSELHRMRYLFLPEIEERLTANGFRTVTAETWMSGQPLGTDSWYGCVSAQVV